MSYSANDNQNFFVQAGRTTSRVLSRPGGNGSISLGGYSPEELEELRRKREAKEAAAAAGATAGAVTADVKENSNNVKTEENVQPKNGEQGHPNDKTEKDDEKDGASPTLSTTNNKKGPVQPTASISSNAFASASTTNSFNVLTDRPTSRVSRPPGGHTSIRLG
jgi:hypothetical protein